MTAPYAIKLWFDADNLWVRLADGRQFSVPLAYFPRLLKANDEERQAYIISVDGLLLGVGDRSRT